MYHTLLKMPWRIWTIKKLVGLASCQADDHENPILEHTASRWGRDRTGRSSCAT
jgi:hypothetical protein